MSNKLLIVVSFLLLLPLRQVRAQGYFLDNPDVKLEYVRKSVCDGKFVWRHTLRITGIADKGTSAEYTTESDFTKQNGKQLFHSAVVETTVVDKNTGNVTMNVGEAAASYIEARTGLNATGQSRPSSMPATLEPGDTLQSVYSTIKVGPLTYTVVFKERKVLRRETISVPAGTFDCIVLSEQRQEKGPGYNRDKTNVSWYCKGVGYVRHDTYIKGKLDTSEILYSIGQ